MPVIGCLDAVLDTSLLYKLIRPARNAVLGKTLQVDSAASGYAMAWK